ncbi:juvenile hormone esterase [Bombyx mori]|uniref:Carboxylesterase type B domain-containing protein n=1 Tax=Bombyx mori TaxID=7091 RepID=A0A8R2ARX8_BOMMO|nr:esterase E4 [Bombyx mori]
MTALNIVFLTFLCVAVEGGVIVETNSGKVEGLEVKSIIKDEKFYSFLSIPYGKAPIGALRFKAPQPHEGWTDVLNAKKERKQCAQYYVPMRPVDEVGFCGSEDCLHLNIHTPKLPNNNEPNLPVIVFLYNEYFRITYNASKEYGPDFFMKEDVILVTISHRVGTFGFVSFGDDLLPGNSGVKDVILALKWIQSNINKFGGNPFKITLMGQDGGAAMVDILLHSPKAKGLFSGAILQSGTAYSSMFFNTKPKDRALAIAEVLERKLSNSAQFISELGSIAAPKISESELMAIHADDSRKYQVPILANGPVVEHDHPDAVITKRPEDSFLDVEIPIMIGYNTRESIEMMERYLRKPQYLTFADRDFLMMFPIRVDYHFELNTNVYYEAIQEIKDFYLEEGYVKISKPGEFMTYMTDINTFYSVDYAVRRYLNESSAQIYYYAFDYSGDLNMRKQNILKDAMILEGTWGASIGDELCYLFVCKPIIKTYLKALAEEDSEEIKVLKSMVRMWTNFAKTGNPTPPGESFQWKPAAKNTKDCLMISDELEMKTNLHEDRIKFWDDFIEKYRQIAVDGVVKGTKDEL